MRRMKLIWLSLVTLWVLPSALNANQGVEAELHFEREFQDQLRFLSNPELARQRVIFIRQQLVRHSGKNFQIYPVPNTGNIGVALDGGVILLDGGTLGKPMNVLAFWLAQEWAHHDLSHSRNAFGQPDALRFASFQWRSQQWPNARAKRCNCFLVGCRVRSRRAVPA